VNDVTPRTPADPWQVIADLAGILYKGGQDAGDVRREALGVLRDNGITLEGDAPAQQPAPGERPVSMAQPVDFSAEPELTERASIRFPADMIAVAKRFAAAEGMTISAWIRREAEMSALRALVAEILPVFAHTAGGNYSALVPGDVYDNWRERAGLPS
jgi:hypothetical protein